MNKNKVFYWIIVILAIIIIVWLFMKITSNNSDVKNCNIKGNINSSGEKIYHIKECGSYDKTQIDELNGEHWFCDENEARTAGWRKAENCP